MSIETISLFSPGDSDWVITIVTKSGERTVRRVAPGKVSEEAAVKAAMVASGVPFQELDYYMARRASDRSLVTNGDEFLKALAEKRR